MLAPVRRDEKKAKATDRDPLALRTFVTIVGLSNYDVRISRCGRRVHWLQRWLAWALSYDAYDFEAHLAGWLQSQLFDHRSGTNKMIDYAFDFVFS